MTQKIQLFVTCLVDTLSPQVGEAIVRVLEKAGVQVEFPPGQTCCGQPAFNAGLRREARPMAKHTIRVLEGSSDPVVIPSGSCAAMIRHGYLELFREDPEWLERANSLARRTYEFSEFLVEVLGIDDLNASFHGKLAYHPSCHLLRDLNVNRQPRILLDNVRDAEIVELPEARDCCGFGGVFSVEHAHISAEMLSRKIANLEATQASVLVACDTGCIMHINGGLKRAGKNILALHLAEILDSGQSKS